MALTFFSPMRPNSPSTFLASQASDPSVMMTNRNKSISVFHPPQPSYTRPDRGGWGGGGDGVLVENQISVVELRNTMNDRDDRHRDSFAVILDRCYSRIKRCATVGRGNCVFNVPHALPGHPLYNVDSCVRFVASHLLRNGFKVERADGDSGGHPHVLQVSWDAREHVSADSFYLSLPPANRTVPSLEYNLNSPPPPVPVPSLEYRQEHRFMMPGPSTNTTRPKPSRQPKSIAEFTIPSSSSFSLSPSLHQDVQEYRQNGKQKKGSRK
jgi:hypothetical protein